MTEHRMSKVGEMMSKMVSWWLASDNFQPIRDKLNLGQKDIIRTCGKIEDLTFIVTHEDGLKEKIGIKQYGMTTDDKNRSFRYCIDEIGRSEYKLNTKLKHNKINDKKIGSAGTDNPRL